MGRTLAGQLAGGRVAVAEVLERALAAAAPRQVADAAEAVVVEQHDGHRDAPPGRPSRAPSRASARSRRRPSRGRGGRAPPSPRPCRRPPRSPSWSSRTPGGSRRAAASATACAGRPAGCPRRTRGCRPGRPPRWPGGSPPAGRRCCGRARGGGPDRPPRSTPCGGARRGRGGPRATPAQPRAPSAGAQLLERRPGRPRTSGSACALAASSSATLMATNRTPGSCQAVQLAVGKSDRRVPIGDDHVRVLGDRVGGGAAGRAQRAQVHRMVPGERALARLRLGDRDAEALGEGVQRALRVGVAARRRRTRSSGAARRR